MLEYIILTDRKLHSTASLSHCLPTLSLCLSFVSRFFFDDRNVSNGWVILSGTGCLSGVLLYISMTRPSLPAARHSYEFQPHSHILQTRAKHRWVAVEERHRQRKRDSVRADGGCLYYGSRKGFIPHYTHTHWFHLQLDR